MTFFLGCSTLSGQSEISVHRHNDSPISSCYKTSSMGPTPKPASLNLCSKAAVAAAAAILALLSGLAGIQRLANIKNDSYRRGARVARAAETAWAMASRRRGSSCCCCDSWDTKHTLLKRGSSLTGLHILLYETLPLQR